MGTVKHSTFCLLLLLLCLSTGCIDTGMQIKKTDPEQAREALEKRDFIEAEKCFIRYLSNNPFGTERWEAWNTMAEIALNVRHNRQAALEIYEAMLLEYAAEPEQYAQIQMKAAEVYYQNKDLTRAMELWAQVFTHENLSSYQKAKAYQAMASIYAQQLEFTAALEVLGYCQNLAMSPAEKFPCYEAEAQIYIAKDEPQHAADSLRKVLQQEGIAEDKKVFASFLLVYAEEQLGNYAQALELASSIRDAYPNQKVIDNTIERLQKKVKK